MSEWDVVARTMNGPVTLTRIVRELGALGVHAGARLLVHSKMSEIGFVPGAHQGVLEALMQAVGDEGLLVMPTFTSSMSEPAHWKNPPVPAAWFEAIRAEMPLFDPLTSPMWAMGLINHAFRAHPKTVRGLHPHTSFAAQGPGAEAIVHPHTLEEAFGEGSPLARLYEADASVLFLGTTYENCTAFHLAEHRSGTTTLLQLGVPMMVDGKRAWVTFDGAGYSDHDFEIIGAAFEAETNAVQIGKIGEATCRLFPIRAAVDFAVDWMRKNR